VVLVLFNRPDRVAETFEVIRAARPSTLFLVADGPRPGHPDDVHRCRSARAVVDAVDWPCEVLRDFGEDNLGTDRRIPIGLDWVFSHVERAIVLEDDIVPVAGFFPWCEAMLDRYDDVDDVMHVSGRNVLVRWPAPGDHLIARRGSVHGWATWASAWRAVDRRLPAAAGDADEILDPHDLEPLVHRHLARHLRAVTDGTLAGWDVRWDLARVLAGGWSVISPVNLVDNRGFGADATRTVNADDLTAALPCGNAPAVVSGSPRPDPDREYDRFALLVELMATYRDPAAVARLSRSPSLLVTADGGPDLDVLHHLAPFAMLDDSIAIVDHLRRERVNSVALEQLDALFHDESTRRSKVRS